MAFDFFKSIGEIEKGRQTFLKWGGRLIGWALLIVPAAYIAWNSRGLKDELTDNGKRPLTGEGSSLREKMQPEYKANDIKYHTYLRTHYNLAEDKGQDSIPRLQGYDTNARTAFFYAIKYGILNDKENSLQSAEKTFNYMKSDKFLNSMDNIKKMLGDNQELMNELFSELKQRPDVTTFLINAYSNENLNKTGEDNFWKSKDAAKNFLINYALYVSDQKDSPYDKYFGDKTIELTKDAMGRNGRMKVADLHFDISVLNSEWSNSIPIYTIIYDRAASQQLEKDAGNTEKAMDRYSLVLSSKSAELPALEINLNRFNKLTESESEDLQRRRSAFTQKYNLNDQTKQYVNPKYRDDLPCMVIKTGGFLGIGKDVHTLDLRTGDLIGPFTKPAEIYTQLFEKYSAENNRQTLITNRDAIIQLIQDREGSLGKIYHSNAGLQIQINKIFDLKETIKKTDAENITDKKTVSELSYDFSYNYIKLKASLKNAFEKGSNEWNKGNGELSKKTAKMIDSLYKSKPEWLSKEEKEDLKQLKGDLIDKYQNFINANDKSKNKSGSITPANSQNDNLCLATPQNKSSHPDGRFTQAKKASSPFTNPSQYSARDRLAARSAVINPRFVGKT